MAVFVAVAIEERLELLFRIILNTLFRGSRVLGLESKEVGFD